MYHAIVKRIALQNFLRVNQKDYAPVLKGCSPDVHHWFGGYHALGGERPRSRSAGPVRPRLSRPGTQLKVVVRGKAQVAEVTGMPFVPHRYVRNP